MSLSSFFYLHTVEWFFKYFYLTQTILFTINHLFAHIYLNGFTYEFLVNSLLIISFLNELEVISLLTSFAVVSTQLNGFSYI